MSGIVKRIYKFLHNENGFGLIISLWLFTMISASVSTILFVESYHSDLMSTIENVKNIQHVVPHITFSDKRINLIVIVIYFTVVQMILLWYVFKILLPKELKLVNNVLTYSANTDMILNEESFSTPIIKDIARNYNKYVDSKIKDRENQKTLLFNAQSLYSSALAAVERNHRMMNTISYPIYVVYNDNDQTIEYNNYAYNGLVGIRNISTELDELDSASREIVQANSRAAFESKQTTICHELRRYRNKTYRCKVIRTPIIDRQFVSVMAIVSITEFERVEGKS